MPFMIIGMIICALGAGLVTRLNLSTPTAQWATYLVIAGMGLGIAQQMPYAADSLVVWKQPNSGDTIFKF